MSTSPLVFADSNSFSSDLQCLMSRVAPLEPLPVEPRSRERELRAPKQRLGSLNTAIAEFGASVGALGRLASTRGLAAHSSDPAKVTVLHAGAAASGIYSISRITSVASAASETTRKGYANGASTPVSRLGSLSLVSGPTIYAITLTAARNNLIGLRDAINAAGAGVTAAVIRTGASATPEYLSVTSSATGATALRLIDDPTGAAVDLLTCSNQGSHAVFQVNGAHFSRSTNLINNDVIAGLTFTIRGATTPGQIVTLSLTSERTRLSDALQTFAEKYNALAAQVHAQPGPLIGLFPRDLLIPVIADGLRRVWSDQGPGSVKSLSALGIAFDGSGTMSVDPTLVNALSDSGISNAYEFLGLSASRFAALPRTFTQLSDLFYGAGNIDSYAAADQGSSNHVAVMTERVRILHRCLAARLRQADHLLERIEAQQQLVAASIHSVTLPRFP